MPLLLRCDTAGAKSAPALICKPGIGRNFLKNWSHFLETYPGYSCYARNIPAMLFIKCSTLRIWKWWQDRFLHRCDPAGLVSSSQCHRTCIRCALTLGCASTLFLLKEQVNFFYKPFIWPVQGWELLSFLDVAIPLERSPSLSAVFNSWYVPKSGWLEWFLYLMFLLFVTALWHLCHKQQDGSVSRVRWL